MYEYACNELMQLMVVVGRIGLCTHAEPWIMHYVVQKWSGLVDKCNDLVCSNISEKEDEEDEFIWLHI